MASRSQADDGIDTTVGDELGTTIDGQVRALIDQRADEIEARLDEVEDDLSELDNYTKITLRDRRVAEIEGNLTKVSDAFSGFAENTTDRLSALDNRLEVTTLLLVALVDALDEADVDIDLSDVQSQQAERLVTDASADERLAEALDRVQS
jgi:archaellum component FlaC